MRAVILSAVLLAVGCDVGQTDAQPKKTKTDLEKLQGEWAQKQPGKSKIRFDGIYAYLNGEKIRTRINEKRDPKEIDFVGTSGGTDGKTMLVGIYQFIDDDQFELAIGKGGNLGPFNTIPIGRPTSFENNPIQFHFIRSAHQSPKQD